MKTQEERIQALENEVKMLAFRLECLTHTVQMYEINHNSLSKRHDLLFDHVTKLDELID
jgi:hypothetical protein